MAFASSNRTAIRRVEETTFGVTPATPAFVDTRYTSESLNYSITNITSNEIRSDRMTSDLVQTEADVSGSIDFEMSYGAFEDFLQHALGDANGFSADYATSETDISAQAGIGFDTVAGDFVADGITVGDWVRVNGFTAANNNGYFRVKAVQPLVLHVEDASGITTESAGPTITISGGKLINGTEEKSFAVEKEFGDAYADAANPTPVFMYFNGVRTCGFTLNVNVGETLSGSFNLQGTAASVQDVVMPAAQGLAASGSSTYTRTSGSFVTDGFTTGMQVQPEGFGMDDNNNVATVTNVVALTLTVDNAGLAEAEATHTDTDISVAAGSNVLTQGAGDFTSTDGPFVEGMCVDVSGFANADNNGRFRVLAVAATTLTMDRDFGTTEGTGPSVTIATCPRSIRSVNPPRFTGATTVAAPTNDVMNAVGNVVQVNTDGLVATSCFNTLTLNYENNCRSIDCVGTLGHRDVKFGRVEVTGTIGLFFENMAEYFKFLDGDNFSFAFHVEDAPGSGQTFGNAYTFNVPFAKYETGQLVSEGLDTNIFFNADFRGLVDRNFENGGTGLNDGAGNSGMLSITKYDAA